ncbi:HBS1-like protein isoform X2 [Hemicordylus capensis]|uniref:HBS1-like protein isoform X2 n=1 Tax=Hemicordylus capensis TaxID=884348 RepID=UPI0023033149|nr:HBS1-like protein isoform X2 [Hemicordylus capensis]
MSASSTLWPSISSKSLLPDFEEDDIYGQSVEDDYCISPSTAAQFIYSRRDNPLEEEYVSEDRAHSNYCISSHQLTGVEKAKLDLCLVRMKEVLGESVPEKVMIEALLNSRFDVQQALDSVLSQNSEQDMKTKDDETMSGGKTTKGLFCSEIFSDVNSLANLVENTSGSTSSCFGLSGSAVKFESPCNPSAPSDKILFRSKYNTSSIKKRTLKSSCKSLGALPLPLSDDIDNKSFYEPVSKQVALPLIESSSSAGSCTESDVCFSSGTNLLKGNRLEKLSWDQSELKTAQDLKVLLRLNETGDSSGFQESVVLQKKSDHNSKGCLDSPPALVNAFESLMLDNKVSYKLNKKTELLGNIPSFCQKKGCFQGSCSSEVDSSTFSVSESPSLADLLQEHQETISNKAFPLSDLCNQLSVGFAVTELGPTSSSQLVSEPQISSGMTELSGSLSSLTFSRSSPVKELESLSLSDLIAKSIELDKPTTTSSHSELHVPKMVPPPVLNPDIDLSVLIRKSVLSPKPVEIQENTLLPETGVLFSERGRQVFVAKGSKKCKKRLRSRFFEGTVSWTKALSARPSAFAITLCLHYPPKRCKRKTASLHKAFLYSRQMQEVKINEIGPLLAITPFDFKSPSPDDIVKLGQKKAFAR